MWHLRQFVCGVPEEMANKALQWNCVGTTADNRKCKANLDAHGNPKWSSKYKSRPQATSAVFKRKPQQGHKCCAACLARHYDLVKSNENKGARGKRKGAAPTDAGLSSRPKIAQSTNELNRLSIGSNSSVPVRTCKPAKTAAAATPASAKRATVVPESAPSVAGSSDCPPSLPSVPPRQGQRHLLAVKPWPRVQYQLSQNPPAQRLHHLFVRQRRK